MPEGNIQSDSVKAEADRAELPAKYEIRLSVRELVEFILRSVQPFSCFLYPSLLRLNPKLMQMHTTEKINAA